ncbi:FIST signal transduction protein [Psychromonas sp. KJ10-10]|uniref:FIST signal transduction protein n=1 Tax=Psychromonas sp. KJ10-10 TaxID=3391823 RepID=UPI0039B617DE
MVTWHSDNGSFETFNEGLQLILAQQPQSIIILSCSDNQYIESDINNLLQTINIPVCGGIYVNVFIGNKLLEQGVLFIGLDFEISNHQFHINDDHSANISQLIDDNTSLKQETSCLMFYDGLMANTEFFLEELYSTLDREMTIAGGGAGYIDFVQRPCVYTNQGLKSDIIQLITFNRPLSTSIGHGWTILDGPFLVTDSNGSTIKSLNYEDAFNVYKETVEKLSQYKFDQHEFFQISRHFPFGIENINGELLVRDPIVHSNSSIQCVGNIPDSSMLYILKGEKDSLINSAVSALNNLNSSECNLTIAFDCISRKLYLQDDFTQELDMLYTHKDTNIILGVLSLGEIANDQGGAMKLLNKSTVIGCL